MDQLISKLTNLTYELVGVVLPGLVAGVLLALTWFAIGGAAPDWTFGILPELSLTSVRAAFRQPLELPSLLCITLGSIVVYVLGHGVLWLSKRGANSKTVDGKEDAERGRRLFMSCLCFRMPRPHRYYSVDLELMYQFVAKRWGYDDKPLNWNEFYRVAKCRLSRQLTYSLVATYQNKYTLHRSVATAAAVWFWANLASVAMYILWRCESVGAPRLPFLIGFAVVALMMIWCFSGSYVLHWNNFGNAIVTEAYSVERIGEGPASK